MRTWQDCLPNLQKATLLHCLKTICKKMTKRLCLPWLSYAREAAHSERLVKDISSNCWRWWKRFSWRTHISFAALYQTSTSEQAIWTFLLYATNFDAMVSWKESVSAEKVIQTGYHLPPSDNVTRCSVPMRLEKDLWMDALHARRSYSVCSLHQRNIALVLAKFSSKLQW